MVDRGHQGKRLKLLPSMRLRSLTYLITLSLAAFVAVPGSALAQEIAIRVNGELITSHDIVQRTLFQNLPSLQNRISDFLILIEIRSLSKGRLAEGHRTAIDRGSAGGKAFLGVRNQSAARAPA